MSVASIKLLPKKGNEARYAALIGFLRDISTGKKVEEAFQDNTVERYQKEFDAQKKSSQQDLVEEAKRKAQEAAAQKKAEEEAKRKEQEADEAKRKAEEEAKRKEQEADEAKRKAEEEAKRKEQEADEAKRKAEEEAKRKEQEAAAAQKKAEEEAEAKRKTDALQKEKEDLERNLEDILSDENILEPSFQREISLRKDVITASELSRFLKEAAREPPLKNVFVPQGNPEMWQVYTRGYGKIKGLDRKYVEDTSKLGKKRLQARVFALITATSKDENIQEERRKALAFSQ